MHVLNSFQTFIFESNSAVEPLLLCHFIRVRKGKRNESWWNSKLFIDPRYYYWMYAFRRFQFEFCATMLISWIADGICTFYCRYFGMFINS